jgi:hypothetical protein
VVQARRAKPRPSRIVVPLAIVIALLVGGSLGVWRFWPDGTTAAPNPSIAVTASSAAPSPSASSASVPTARPTTRSTQSTNPASPAARTALKNCRERVRAADEVRGEAKTGIAHWAAHVNAEREASRGNISVDTRQKIFNETRLAGPGDQKRYAAAIRRYERLDASCGKAKGADKKIAASLADCQERLKALQHVLDAAAPAMKDWKQHLADMARSREFHIKNAQGIWLRAYQAAPPNINAYERAAKRFDPPDC